MKIETLKLTLNPYRVDRKGTQIFLAASHQHEPELLTAVQEAYLQQLAAGKSLQQLAIDHISQKQPYSFREAYQLMLILIRMKVITSNEVIKYFTSTAEVKKSASSSGGSGGASAGTATSTKQAKPTPQWTLQSLGKVPFFRNLAPGLLEIFIEHAELLQIPERTQVIHRGQKERDLFVILEGEASIYNEGKRHRQLITVIPAGSVFGEGAFFFDRPRSADVISNCPSTLIKIKFNEKALNSLMHHRNTEELQQRLWIAHGLLSSPVFQQVPTESLDGFLHLGKLRQVSAGQTLFNSGDFGDSFFVVIQGTIEINRKGRHLRTLKQGDIFGEIALLINDNERTASALCTVNGLVLEVSHGEFFKVLAQNLVLAKEIETVAYRRYKEVVK